MKDVYVGLDIHTENFYGTIMDKQGEILGQGTIKYSMEGVQSFLGWLPSTRIKVAIEACGIWRGVYRLLAELGYDVVLASPLKTHRIVAKKKTDKVDSKTLADLLRTGYLPEVYIPDEDVIKLRDIARHRARLVRIKTMLQCKIRAYLDRDGIKHTPGWSRESLATLKKMDPTIANFVAIMETVNEQIKEVTREINNIAHNRYSTKLLQTVPGIGDISSLMILGEIGDIKRFDNPKSLVSYAGLCPGIYQSGNKSHDIVNRACNKWLKWIITECSGRAAMLDNRYMKHFYRVKNRKGSKVARRSVGRKMLTDIWYILTNEEPFRESRSFSQRTGTPPTEN